MKRVLKIFTPTVLNFNISALQHNFTGHFIGDTLQVVLCVGDRPIGSLGPVSCLLYLCRCSFFRMLKPCCNRTSLTIHFIFTSNIHLWDGHRAQVQMLGCFSVLIPTTLDICTFSNSCLWQANEKIHTRGLAENFV